ncbi:MAG: VWA domain-containing protein, partial [Bacilli bacterium]|nr:VWA domain-containing protein [Bacilli bacterium]
TYYNIIREDKINQVWTDKSVSNSDMNINNQLINKNSDEAFLSSLSAFSVGLDLNIKEGNVKDIIILQDLSGSMSLWNVTSSSGSMTRLQASKNAINSLLQIIANVNDSLSPEDEKFHVSLISFSEQASSSNSAAVIFNLTEVSNSNLSSLQASIDYMQAPPSSGTYIAPGLTLSLTQLQTYDRSNVDSCIINFLDGLANDSASAITIANTLKSNNSVIMYSIILNNDAQGGTSTAIDLLGQALSSNYDYATSSSNLGIQTGNTYYFIPSTADDLIDSFEKIIKSIQRKIYTLEKGSNLTFKDTLGNYMGVKRLKAIVYDGVSYTNVSAYTSGATTTYTFQGIVVDSLGSPANLNQIVIRVTKSTNTQAGDTITISIPYNLVPLAVYDISSTFLTTSTAYTTKLMSATPISIVYSSCL